MSGHLKTWLVWLDNLSPMQKTITNFTGDDRRSMAEALSIASPGGPSGVACVDECNCQGGAAKQAHLLYAEIHAKIDTQRDVDEIIRELKIALIADQARSSPRLEVPYLARGCSIRRRGG